MCRQIIFVLHLSLINPILYFSAGVGRTGVFLAIDLTIDEIERSGKDNVDIFNLVVRFRHRRTNMVQTTVS